MFDNAFLLTTKSLQNIIEQLPNYVFVKDCEGRYQFCNENFARMVGLDNPADIRGKTDYEMLWTKDTAKIYAYEDQLILSTGEEISNREVPMIFLNHLHESHLLEKQTRWLSVSKRPLYNEQEKIIGVLGIYIDITEQRRAVELEKEKKIAEKNAEVMNILSSSIAHEIRTPLSIIKINADLINLSNVMNCISEPEKKNQFKKNIKNIYQALKECTQVMDMVLVKLRKIAMFDAKEASNSLQVCSIESIINMALSEYPFRDNEREKVHYIKSSSKSFKFQGHERLTKHVLFNLIKNSLSVIQEAGKGEIFIECQHDETFNRLIFRDTALGIDPEYLPKIFNKFETMDDAHSGTGLGLAFCKLVMESYLGKIECHSKLGEFTEFVLFFPS